MKKELFPLLLLWTAGAHATSPSSTVATSDTDSRVSILEAQMNEVSTRTVHGNFGAKTASASPRILGDDWFLTADMLWWHVDTSGSKYCLLDETPPGAPDSKGTYRTLKFKWNYGFRAGVGTTFNHDRWDLYLNYTWFRADNSSATSLHGGFGIIPDSQVLINQRLGNAAEQSKIHWSIHFQTLDLNLGRNYFISPKVAFHPFFGIKTAWIDQKVRSSNKLFFPVITHSHTKTKNDFWGIGPDLGIEGKWFLNYGFNLFGSIASALLWGDFDVRQKQHTSNPSTPINDIDFDKHAVSPMTQMQIGIGYETNFCDNQYHIAVNARYEQQYWWAQNQIPDYVLLNTYEFMRVFGDLSFQGLTIDVRFDF